jgi:MFS family permease
MTGRDGAPAGTGDDSVAPLLHNREFVLLQAGQLLSAGGTQVASIAYPLLVLSLTHSPAKAGLVAFARLLPNAVFGLLAGVAADRFDRRRVMVAADGVRALAVGGVVAAILLERLAFWQLPLAAFVEGTGNAFFGPAAAGALRSVVPPAALPAAAGLQQARTATVALLGPPIGGALFGVARSAPFVADAASYAVSVATVLLMRARFQEQRARDTATLRARVAEGLRFLWGHPFLRTTTLLYGLANFIGPGVLLAIVVVGRRQGLSGGAIGLLLAAFGASLLVGSLVSPLLRRALTVRTILLLELWTWTGSAAFVVWPNVYVLTAALLVSGIAIPVTDSVVIGYRLAITPDRLVGRVESVRSNIALVTAPLGPLAAGLLLGALSPRATVAVFACCGLALACWGTLSRALRSAPRLEEVA